MPEGISISWQRDRRQPDNAIGCAIMMEAARILVAWASSRGARFASRFGRRKKRFIRVAAYVTGSFWNLFEAPKPGFEKFGGYFKHRLRHRSRAWGFSIWPAPGAEIMREILEPSKLTGVVGAVGLARRNLGGSGPHLFQNAWPAPASAWAPGSDLVCHDTLCIPIDPGPCRCGQASVVERGVVRPAEVATARGHGAPLRRQL